MASLDLIVLENGRKKRKVSENETVDFSSVRIGASNLEISEDGSNQLSVNTIRITNVVDPTGAQDAATKNYVDAVAAGLSIKKNVRVASTAAVDISSAPAAIDGITLAADDRVLIKDGSTANTGVTSVDNGIYIFNGAASAMTRAADLDNSPSGEIFHGVFIPKVIEGTANGGLPFVIISTGTGVDDVHDIGTDGIQWEEFTSPTQLTEGNGIDITGNVISVDLAAIAGAGLVVNGSVLDVNVDDSTIEIASDVVQVKDSGITTAKINNLAVTTAKINDDAVTAAKLNADTAGDGLVQGAGGELDVNVDDASIEIASDVVQVKDSGITTAKIADDAVTAAKLNADTAGLGLVQAAGGELDVNVDDSTIEIASDVVQVKDSGITTAKINNLAVTTAKINDDAVTAAKINADVAGDGLVQGAGGELDVNVDDASIEIASDVVQVKDSGITTAKIAADAVTGAKIRLDNDEFLRGRNNADNADIDILKVDASDNIVFGSLPQAAGTPTVDNDLVNKGFLDSALLSSGLVKSPARVSSATNIDISTGGLLTVDGVTLLAGDRVLLTGQSDPAENGVYEAAAGTWSRAADLDEAEELIEGVMISVKEGNTRADTLFVLQADVTTVDTTAVDFDQNGANADALAGAGLVNNAGALDINLATNSGLQIITDELQVDLEAAGAGTGGLTLNGNEIRVLVDTTAGLALTASGLAVQLEAAGAGTGGLAFDNGEIRVDAGNGIELTADGVAVQAADSSINVAAGGISVDFTEDFTNEEGATISAGEVVYESSAGNVSLALASDTLGPGTTFGIVSDATIANTASGEIFIKAGAIIGGFSSLTVGDPVYLSRTTAGAIQQDLTGFVATENVVRIGYAISATQIHFHPEWEFEF